MKKKKKSAESKGMVKMLILRKKIVKKKSKNGMLSDLATQVRICLPPSPPFQKKSEIGKAPSPPCQKKSEIGDPLRNIMASMGQPFSSASAWRNNWLFEDSVTPAQGKGK